MCKRRRRDPRRHTDIAAAEKKLRQAVFFLRHLGQVSKETPRYPGQDDERLEFYFSACLSAAQSVYYVLEEAGGATFKTIQKDWRDHLLEQRAGFERMIGLRDDDVHRASTGAELFPNYVQADPQHYRILGSSSLVEMENPDGTKVSGPALMGSVGLYIGQKGQRTEATDACREFIDQLTSLLEAARAAASAQTTAGDLES
jgi:hypothetical protein